MSHSEQMQCRRLLDLLLSTEIPEINGQRSTFDNLTKVNRNIEYYAVSQTSILLSLPNYIGRFQNGT